jgi:DNA-binding MarR family transcriptional regulator
MLQEYAQELLALRLQWHSGLPGRASPAVIDLIFLLVARLDCGRGTPLKQVYGLLPYSESNIRRYLRQLERDGWLTVREDEADRRAGVAVPTAKLLQSFQAYALGLKRLSERFAQAAPSSAPSPEAQPPMVLAASGVA